MVGFDYERIKAKSRRQKNELIHKILQEMRSFIHDLIDHDYDKEMKEEILEELYAYTIVIDDIIGE